MSGLQRLNRTSLIMALSAYGLFWVAGCEDKAKTPSKATNSAAATTSSSGGAGHKEHAGHDHDHDHDHDKHEAAGAPHKGELVEVGEEVAHLELVLDAETGKLTAYVLDAAGKKDVTVAMTELKLQFAAGKKGSLPADGFQDLVLKAVDAKDGKASQFSGTSDKLKGVKEFTGVFASLKVGEKPVDNIPVKFPSGHHH